MIILSAIVVAALLVVIALQLRELRKVRQDAWTREQGLLNRIQHPQTFQVPDAPPPTDEEIRTKPDIPDWDLVGTIQPGEPE